MTNAIDLLDVVALAVDLPEAGLRRDQVGTVVEVFAEGAFEVEFSDSKGRTVESVGVRANQLLRLRHRAGDGRDGDDN